MKTFGFCRYSWFLFCFFNFIDKFNPTLNRTKLHTHTHTENKIPRTHTYREQNFTHTLTNANIYTQRDYLIVNSEEKSEKKNKNHPENTCVYGYVFECTHIHIIMKYFFLSLDQQKLYIYIYIYISQGMSRHQSQPAIALRKSSRANECIFNSHTYIHTYIYIYIHDNSVNGRTDCFQPYKLTSHHLH